ncbi:sporulation protein YpjB [Bacillus sp. S/N-304-OC-R1]|uniref:sporulation protein YpjB n=1 Tax=Bacillus sp. S/N-304-OC-R1 TaxID=2758034 RepID=UPI001C8EBAD1|nr:sporulation protein YpjB [Bacillus sp. S/N-304-OC-R1]MBY0122604.1 sporulation protein YpjB [Bacillus sp. S/N-304-OC-R1]
MKVRLIVTVIMLFLLLPISVFAKETSPVDRLDQLSDEALQMVKLHRYEDAKKLLEYFSEQFVSVTGKERPFTPDELRIVTVSHDEAVQAAANATMNHEEKINRVTKFRLVMDAITSPYQPLWTEMESPIMTMFGEVKEAAYIGDTQQFNSNLNSFLSLYDIIHPSIKINVDRERIQRIDARIEFIDKYRPQVLTETASHMELEALEADLQLLFDEMTEDEADPSLWWVIISTGSIIILTLSYVGWRKYKGDQEKEKSLSRRQKD